jgi:molybdate/tungstate transport system ATP-binding protein
MGGTLELRNVYKEFDGFKLDNLSLTLDPGEYYVLVGPTGSGKTLLLETINGFHTIDYGIILFDGKDITDLPPAKRSIGYVPQTPNLNDRQTVRQNIEFTVRLRGLPGDWTNEINGVMQMMSLTPLADAKALSLSGGERRKVALARAIVLKPDLLLLDEPLSSLDVSSKQALRDELRQIHRYLGCTVIHVTHNQVEALELATRVGVMRRGTIVNTGTLQEVFDDPVDEYAARFLGYTNIYPATAIESRRFTKMSLGGVTVRAARPPRPGQSLVGIHGDDVTLHTVTPVNVRDNVFRATVSDVADAGPSVTVTLDMGVPLRITQSKRRFQETGLTVGDEVWVQFSPEAVKQLAP